MVSGCVARLAILFGFPANIFQIFVTHLTLSPFISHEFRVTNLVINPTTNIDEFRLQNLIKDKREKMQKEKCKTMLKKRRRNKKRIKEKRDKREKIIEKERKGINKHKDWKNYINIARIMNRKCEKIIIIEEKDNETE